MNYHNLENSREFKAAKNLEDALNDMCFDNKKFTAAIPTYHRTLQQNLMRRIVQIVLFMADEENVGTDLRNKGAVRTAQILREAIEENRDEICLPYI